MSSNRPRHQIGLLTRQGRVGRPRSPHLRGLCTVDRSDLRDYRGRPEVFRSAADPDSQMSAVWQITTSGRVEIYI